MRGTKRAAPSVVLQEDTDVSAEAKKLRGDVDEDSTATLDPVEVYGEEDIERIRRLRRQRARGLQEEALLPKESSQSGENDESTSVGAWGAPDEYPMEPFHMKDELRHGQFDAAGFYIPNVVDPDDVTDAWLSSLDEKDSMPPPASAPQRHVAKKPSSEDAYSAMETRELILALTNYLEPPSESPLEALKRLKQQTGPSVSGKKKPSMTEEAKKAFDVVTEVSNVLLLSRGIHDALFCPRDKLLTLLQKHGGDTRGSPPGGRDEEEMLWQFRYSGVRTVRVHGLRVCRWLHEIKKGNPTIHGPYTSLELLGWIKQKYISDETPVEVREVLPSGTPVDGIWRHWKSVRFEGDQDTTEDDDAKQDEADEVTRLERARQNTKNFAGDNDSDEDVDYGT